LTDLDEILKTLKPVVLDGEFVVLVVGEGEVASLSPIATITEPEGWTVVVRREDADAGGLTYSFIGRWITLQVHSALDAVGLTAAFSTALGRAGISCNVFAGYHHDHILVPSPDADRAVAVLHALSHGADG
jgi:hypothetical protein